MPVSENPDLPRDEYEDEAVEILRRLGSESSSDSNMISTVIEVFEKALGGNQVSRGRLRSAGAQLHELLRSRASKEQPGADSAR